MTFYRVLSASNPNPTVNLPAAWQGNQAGMSGQSEVSSEVPGLDYCLPPAHS